jgi:hypothetical protein
VPEQERTHNSGGLACLGNPCNAQRFSKPFSIGSFPSPRTLFVSGREFGELTIAPPVLNDSALPGPRSAQLPRRAFRPSSSAAVERHQDPWPQQDRHPPADRRPLPQIFFRSASFNELDLRFSHKRLIPRSISAIRSDCRRWHLFTPAQSGLFSQVRPGMIGGRRGMDEICPPNLLPIPCHTRLSVRTERYLSKFTQ